MKRTLEMKDSRLEALELKVQQHVSPLISFSLKLLINIWELICKLKK